VDGVKSVLDIGSPSKVFDREVGQMIALGVIQGINKQKAAANKSANDLMKIYLKGASHKLTTIKKKNKLSLNEELKYWTKLRKTYKKGSNKYMAASVEIASIHASIVKNSITADKNRLALKKRYNNMSLADELAYWKKLLSKAKKNSNRYKAIQSEISSLNSSISDKILESASDKLDTYKRYNDLSIKDEITYWTKIKSSLTKGTAAYTEANLKILELQKQMKDESKSLSDEYQSNIDDLTSGLKKDVKSVMDEYKDAVKTRADSISTGMDLFTKFNSNSRQTSKSLINNLKSQVKGLTEYDDALKSLEQRGIPDGMLSQLESMGPEALSNIKTLVKMTDDEWTEYLSLWQQKYAKANERALDEVDEQDYLDKIQDLTDAANENMQKLTKEYTENMNKLGLEVVTSSVKIGSSLVDGISEGINAESDKVLANIDKLIADVIEKAKETAKIGSPSKVMSDEVGKNLTLGILEGFENEMPAALSDMQSALDDTMSSVKADDTKINLNNFASSIKSIYENIAIYFESIETRLSKSVNNMAASLNYMIDTGQMVLNTDGSLGYISLANNINNKSNGSLDLRDNSGVSGDTGGDTYIFNSSKAIDEVEAARLLKKTKRDLAEGF
jgi:hypothetical protein